MDAANRATDDFEGDRRSWNGDLGPWDLDETFDIEYFSDAELSNGRNSPQFEEVCQCTHTGSVVPNEVIILSSSSDEDNDIEILEYDPPQE